MTSDLDRARARAEASDPASAPGVRAEVWLELAELEPAFKHRGAEAARALDRATALLATESDPARELRAALRGAQLALIADDAARARELAELALVCARRADDVAAGLAADALLLRARLLAGELDACREQLQALARELLQQVTPAPPLQQVSASRAELQLALAAAELHLVDGDFAAAAERYQSALDALPRRGRDALVDEEFQALQGVALTAQLGRRPGRAAEHLRRLLELTVRYQAARDELDARLALGNTLVSLGKLPEARRQLDRARALAGTAGGVDERLLAASSAALAALHARDFAVALDRAYEALRHAGRGKRDVTAYVAAISLIASIHVARENFAEAYLALANGAAALRHVVGPVAAALLEVEVDALREQLGHDRFEQMCADILAQRQAGQRRS